MSHATFGRSFFRTNPPITREVLAHVVSPPKEGCLNLDQLIMATVHPDKLSQEQLDHLGSCTECRLNAEIACA